MVGVSCNLLENRPKKPLLASSKGNGTNLHFQMVRLVMCTCPRLVSPVILVLCLTTPEGGGQTCTFGQDRTNCRASMERSSGAGECVHLSCDSLCFGARREMSSDLCTLRGAFPLCAGICERQMWRSLPVPQPLLKELFQRGFSKRTFCIVLFPHGLSWLSESGSIFI